VFCLFCEVRTFRMSRIGVPVAPACPESERAIVACVLTFPSLLVSLLGMSSGLCANARKQS
jgi:hypothetical protein